MMTANRQKIRQIEEILTRDLENRRSEQMEAVTRELQEQEERTLKEAGREADKIKADAREKATRTIKLAVTQARFQKNRELMMTRESKVGEIIGEIKSQFDKFRDSNEYKDFLKKLVVEAAHAIGDNEIILSFNEKDYRLFEQFLRTEVQSLLPGKQIRLRDGSADTRGGVVVENALGNRRVEHTFEVFLDQVRDAIGKELYKHFV